MSSSSARKRGGERGSAEEMEEGGEEGGSAGERKRFTSPTIVVSAGRCRERNSRGEERRRDEGTVGSRRRIMNVSSGGDRNQPGSTTG